MRIQKIISALLLNIALYVPFAAHAVETHICVYNATSSSARIPFEVSFCLDSGNCFKNCSEPVGPNKIMHGTYDISMTDIPSLCMRPEGSRSWVPVPMHRIHSGGDKNYYVFTAIDTGNGHRSIVKVNVQKDNKPAYETCISR